MKLESCSFCLVHLFPHLLANGLFKCLLMLGKIWWSAEPKRSLSIMVECFSENTYAKLEEGL